MLVTKEWIFDDDNVIRLSHHTIRGKYILSHNGVVVGQWCSFVDIGWKKKITTETGNVYKINVKTGWCGGFTYSCVEEERGNYVPPIDPDPVTETITL